VASKSFATDPETLVLVPIGGGPSLEPSKYPTSWAAARARKQEVSCPLL